MDERQWIHAIQKGDKQYLKDIVEKYYDDIFRFCAFQSGSGEDAYDLAQETFLKFIRYVEGYRYRNLKGYLLTVAMNLCAERGRSAMTKAFPVRMVRRVTPCGRYTVPTKGFPERRRLLPKQNR